MELRCVRDIFNYCNDHERKIDLITDPKSQSLTCPGTCGSEPDRCGHYITHKKAYTPLAKALDEHKRRKAKAARPRGDRKAVPVVPAR